MKRVFSIMAVALTAAMFTACGPSAEDKAKMEEREKQIKDSIAASINQSMESENTTDSAAAGTNTTAAPAEQGHDHGAEGHHH